MGGGSRARARAEAACERGAKRGTAGPWGRAGGIAAWRGGRAPPRYYEMLRYLAISFHGPAGGRAGGIAARRGGAGGRAAVRGVPPPTPTPGRRCGGRREAEIRGKGESGEKERQRWRKGDVCVGRGGRGACTAISKRRARLVSDDAVHQSWHFGVLELLLVRAFLACTSLVLPTSGSHSCSLYFSRVIH